MVNISKVWNDERLAIVSIYPVVTLFSFKGPSKMLMSAGMVKDDNVYWVKVFRQSKVEEKPFGYLYIKPACLFP